MILAGFFDESLSQRAGEPICVGGYVFKPSDYKKFGRRWREALKLGGRRFKHFHMTDLYAGHGVYEGLAISERVVLLDKAIDAIADYAYAGVAVHFDQKEFEARAPKDWLRFYGSIYSGACQMILQTATHWLRKEKRCHLPITYVFERGHKHRAECDAVLTAIGNNGATRKQFQYESHRFEDKDREYGLQAADLLAWAVTKLHVDPKARSMAAFAPSLKRMAIKDNGRSHVHSFTGDKLDRLFAEQMKGPPVVTATVGPRKRTFK